MVTYILNTIKYKTKLTDNIPFKEPYRRILPVMFRQHLKEILESDTIRPS